MKRTTGTIELIAHLTQTLGLTPSQATRALDEMLAYFDETPEQYVQRRHRELQLDDVPNALAYDRISAELAHVRFATTALSVRQIRRIIYG